MAGHAHDGDCDMADGLATRATAETGVLVVFRRQSGLDRLGMAKPCVCIDRASDIADDFEHSRDKKKQGELTPPADADAPNRRRVAA